ncbi:MAG TPA: quinone-dependent dihydroorotate dehydrogenase [Chitinophagaceae bacterium]|nr:quinone-dependent dihydroorotate dehydrogenase [Chitinophagaceae bacterium]
MYRLLRNFLFLFDAERIHRLVMGLLQGICNIPGGKLLLRSVYAKKVKAHSIEVMGLQFRNPVGMAAGFDKNARYLDALDCLGFGFLEIGTVTPLPQLGNEPPRLFRLPEDGALINRMGFNNDGAAAIATRLKHRPDGLVIGGNIGRNKITSNEDAAGDYLECFHGLFDVVDYFVVNVSSPNTPGLRDLQQKDPLGRLLDRLQQENMQHSHPKPVLLKISPDLDHQQLDDVIGIALDSGISGIVATNTSLDHSGLKTPREILDQAGAGGLSGMPIRDRSTEIIRYIHRKSQGKLVLIASGGVFNARDAREKLDAGASLVQLYTGFIYEGPFIVSRICRGMA